MFENIKSVIFDLDGTLVDSMWMWKAIDIEFLGARNIELPDDLQNVIEGFSFHETAVYFKERFHLSESLETIKKIWLDMSYEKYTHEVPLKPGAQEFLEILKKNDITVGIASSNHLDLIHAVLKSHHVLDYFDSIHTCCEVSAGKPSPDIYNLVSKDLSTPANNCFVFEDIIMGILAGKRAGMHTCAVYDTYSIYQDEEKKKLADYYIRDYKEILTLPGKEIYG
ncbi:MAG: HAD family phosphatase [Lachnospiraceae bacterium]|nr:HAD family phosphatase [Lachnospiraceae bacterium]MDD3614989.1 HAD family phosphatase [Lachnospiraceae bacterium]